MNTSGSRDLTRKYRKRINQRTRRVQGYFYSSHSLINRNSSFQANSAGFSEYILHNSNARSYNTRFNLNRNNVGYFKPRPKHISSQSIGRDKEHSALGCYEEYTLRKIRTTSDMIKQQLMSPEHSSITSESERNMELDNTSSKIRCNQTKFCGESSKVSDKKEYQQTKLKKKPSKSAEEVFRLKMKEKRKNELREKFRKDKISKQKSTETYNVKEISDKILKHISKMNNEKLIDFLNIDNSRYEEVFNYICKKKSFELTKALRDLSHQDKPEACEIVNSIIPDFSIKIEELPINIIKELSSTFDELHKNIDNSSSPVESLHMFNGNDTFQHSSESPYCMQPMFIASDSNTNNSYVSSEMYVKNDKDIKQKEYFENSKTTGNSEIIEILDSDEETLSLRQNSVITTRHPMRDHVLENIGESTKSFPTSEVDFNSSTNLIHSSNITNKEISNFFPKFVSCVQERGVIDPSDSLNSNNSQFSCNVSDIPPFIGQQIIDLNSNNETASSQQCENGLDEIMKNEVVRIGSSLLQKVQDTDGSDITKSPLQMSDQNTDTKVGSVWVSKNIFQTSDNLKEAEEFYKPDESHVENLENSVQENPALRYIELPDSEKKSVSTSADLHVKSNTLKKLDAIQIQKKESSPRLPNTTSLDDTPKNIVSISSPPTIQEKSLFISGVDHDNHTSRNRIEKKKKKRFYDSTHVPRNKKKDSITPKDVNNHCEKQFITLNIKPFEKPKNLFDALNFMKVIDQKIAILNKLRQDIFNGLHEAISSSDRIAPTSKKKKIDHPVKEKTIRDESSKTHELTEKADKHIGKKTPRPFSALDCIDGVPLFCRVLHDKDECIVGTDNGMIQYYNIYENKPLMTVNIGNSAISFLEYVRLDRKISICTGNTTDPELKILKYKNINERKIHLEDSIQSFDCGWEYFFIGGKRGYLTRYDPKRETIQYEDRISESGIKFLKTSREGPRRMLVILFEDADGQAHVHVRDAMTALHIRTIVDLKYPRYMHVKFSTLYLATDGELNVYNCCDGGFVKKIISENSFSSMESKSHLMILGTSEGIHALNMRTNEYLGCIKAGMPILPLAFFKDQIICQTRGKKIELVDVPESLKELLDRSKNIEANHSEEKTSEKKSLKRKRYYQ